MDIINELINFFGIATLSQSASIVDLVEFVVKLYFAVFVLLAIFKGLFAMTKFR